MQEYAAVNTKSQSEENQLGIVETQKVQLCQEGLALESGPTLGPIEVAFETYGTLNEQKSNAILVVHALSGGAHAAGFLPGHEKPGWWDCMIGPGKAFDTNRFFIVCSNCLGSCYGTTGPSSINPETGKPYALQFPLVTVRDMVHLQRHLMDYLGIPSWLTVTGGSMGGMQALQWAISYPERVRSAIPIATTHRHSPQQIAFNEVARQAIMTDPAWNNGDYYGGEGPIHGLAIARMVGHITYLSDLGMERKFGRRLRDKERFGFDFSIDFEVESYLKYQGESFVQRFDANSLLYLTKALDYFDAADGYESLTEAFRNCESLFLIMAFTSDWLYPPQQNKEIAQAIRRAGGDATTCEISSDYGHDAFLLEYKQQEPLIRSFLQRVQEEI